MTLFFFLSKLQSPYRALCGWALSSSLPHPLASLPFYSLCFSHMGLLGVPDTCQPCSCLRVFASGLKSSPEVWLTPSIFEVVVQMSTFNETCPGALINLGTCTTPSPHLLSLLVCCTLFCLYSTYYLLT